MSHTRLIILTITLLLLILIPTLYSIQNYFIYPGLRRHLENFKDSEFSYIDGSLYKSGTGDKLNGDKLIIIIGGNGSVPTDFIPFVKGNDHFLLVGYYGPDRDISPTSESISKHLGSILNLITRSSKINSVKFICHSIGCGIALDYLSKNKLSLPTEIVLLAPFCKLSEIISKESGIPIQLIKSVLAQEWDNEEAITKLGRNTDVTLIHGRIDDLINWSNSERLSKLYKPCKLILTDDDHNSIVKNVLPKFI